MLKGYEQDKIEREQADVNDDDNETRERGEEDDRDSEQLGIRSGAATLSELRESREEILSSVDSKEIDLGEVIGPVPYAGNVTSVLRCTYTPFLVTFTVTTFCQWYLGTGELLSPSGITGMWGMHFSALGNPTYYAVEKLRAAVAATMSVVSSSPQLFKVEEEVSSKNAPGRTESPKCLILFEGQVIWNDFFDHDVVHFYEFIRLQQNGSLREAAQFIRDISSASSNFSVPPQERTGETNQSIPDVDGKNTPLQKFQTFSRYAHPLYQ